MQKYKDIYKIYSNREFQDQKYLFHQTNDYKTIVAYLDEFSDKEEEFQEYLRNRILNSHMAQSMDGKAAYIIRQLFKAYVTNPQQLPDKTISTIYKNLLTKSEIDDIKIKKYNQTGEFRNRLKNDHIIGCNDNYKNIVTRVICDYIGGMTDNYALQQYKKLYESGILI